MFVPAEYHLPALAEKAEYDKHENDPEDTRYRDFLNRLVEPFSRRLAAGASGLDFGCGPRPAIKPMLAEKGLAVANYDIYFFPDDALLMKRYDFVTATEVVEHLRQPRQTLDKVWDCVNAGGHLGLMTKLVRDKTSFARWHYKNDPTHICFFSLPTMNWLAKQWNAEFTRFAEDAFSFQKPIAS